MAYTKKTTGIAANLISCVGVDQDGTTVIDFCGNALTVHANVTTGTDSWKTVNRGYFETFGNGTNDFFGVLWNAPKPVYNISSGQPGGTIFIAYAGANPTVGSGARIDLQLGSSVNGLYRLNNTGTGNAGAAYFRSSSATGTGRIGTTTVPTDGSTKFSLGSTWQYNVTSEMFFGYENGSLASDSTASSPGGSGGLFDHNAIGGMAGQGNTPAKRFIVATFNTVLTLTQIQSLHDDWFNVLLEAGATISEASGSSAGIGAATAIGNATASSTGSASGLGAASAAGTSESITKGVQEWFNIVAYDGSPVGARNNVNVMWWDESPPIGNPDLTFTNESWTSDGFFECALPGTSLSIDGEGHITIFSAGADKFEDIGFTGRMVVKDIS